MIFVVVFSLLMPRFAAACGEENFGPPVDLRVARLRGELALIPPPDELRRQRDEAEGAVGAARLFEARGPIWFAADERRVRRDREAPRNSIVSSTN